jgi:hypothetical protein
MTCFPGLDISYGAGFACVRAADDLASGTVSYDVLA